MSIILSAAFSFTRRQPKTASVNTQAKPIKDASRLKNLESTLPQQPYKRWEAANRRPTEDPESLGSFIVW
jgi:hypothetical protein